MQPNHGGRGCLSEQEYYDREVYILEKSNKKTVFEPEKGRTIITVCRVFGEQSILDLYSEYVAEKVRAQRRAATAEAAKKAG